MLQLKMAGNEPQLLIIVLFVMSGVNGDIPCAARKIPNQSVVCVCNATYCDTVTRVEPSSGSYVAYMSSEGGLRFQKTTGKLTTFERLDSSLVTIELDPDNRFQTIEGFGGAATDAAGINWKNLSEPLQKYLIDSYFSAQGIQYNVIRVPIGGCDFSTHPYAYNELPVNDFNLSNFSLSLEDFQYKIPLIKSAMAASNESIHVLGTVWSPPSWMKSNSKYSGFSRLLPQCYQTYADYILKFIQKYTSEGVPIWGITTTNEPTNGDVGLISFNSLGWVAENMGNWIVNNLGPTIRNSDYKDIKILAVDDQRLFLYYWWNAMIAKVPKVLEYVDGAALHYYSDSVVPASIQVEAMKAYPDKFLMNTEACEGSDPWVKKVIPGSWQRAYNYIYDIITNLNHQSVGWIDWNLCLNSGGGPNWSKNFVDSPILVYPEHDEFIKQPMFYAMGHFAKWIPRGSIRIAAEVKKYIFTSFESVAVKTPLNTYVVVFYNKGSARAVNIKIGSKLAIINCPEAAVVTVEMPCEP